MQYRSKARLLYLTVLIILPLLGGGGCRSGKNGADSKTPRETSVRPVQVFELQKNDHFDRRTFPGTAKALQETRLSFRVSGPLVDFTVDTGQFFPRNAVIAKIDPRDFRIRIKTMEARLDAARADYAEARLQFGRYQKLVAENAAAQATFDRIKSVFEKAEAQVETAVRNLENARNALADTVLYAPFAGYVDRQFVENSEIVQAGQPIVSMVDLSALEVQVALPEDMLPTVDRFQTYQCRFAALPGRTFTAQFKEVGKQPNPSKHTFPLTLLLEGLPENTPLRPGMAAQVTITIARQDTRPVFVVPVSAVVNDHNNQAYVWIVQPEAGRLRRQPVEAGSLRKNGMIEITGDLQAGQLIASAGAHTLTAAQKIRVMAPVSETNTGREL